MSESSIPQLVESDWLADNLDAPDLHVLDCTVYLDIDRDTGEIETTSGYADWQDGHIPGSRFADLITDFSVSNDPEFWFQRPSTERFADEIADLGVSNESRVVLYDATDLNIWAARLWWLLRVFGFDRAGILNGGWTEWTSEDRPISTESRESSRGSFTAKYRSELIATKDEVLDSIEDNATCLVNALRTEDHLGDGPVKYGRPGRIPGSVNVPAAWDDGIVDPRTARYRPRDELRRMFARVGAVDRERVITYCGGAISAASVAFALNLVGIENVAVYDGSLDEWGHDPALPMVTGHPDGTGGKVH